MVRRKSKKPPVALIYGDADFNGPYISSIGTYLTLWSTIETIFLELLRALADMPKQTAVILWAPLSPRARLELVSALARAYITDANLLKRILDAIEKFKKLGTDRHVFAHGAYHYDPKTERLTKIQGIRPDHQGKRIEASHPVKVTEKTPSSAMLNEIKVNAKGFLELNRIVWELVRDVQSALGTRQSTLPVWLGAPQSSQGHRRASDKAQKQK